MKGSFVQARLDELAPWLAGTQGTALTRALGKGEDEDVRALEGAVLQWSPETCADDALDLLGRWFGLPRYPGEPNGTAPASPGATGTGYRGRLCVAWVTWSWAGTKRAIVEQIQAFGVPDVQVIADDEATLGLGSWYSRFVVVLGPNLGALNITPTLQGVATQGAPTLQGGTGSPELLSQIKAITWIVLKFKAPHGYPLDLVVLLSSSPFAGAGSIPGSYVNADGEYLLHATIGHLLPLEAPTYSLPYQV